MGKLLKTFGIYFMGNIVNRLMGFVVMSIATFQIAPDDYGYFTVSNSLMNIIMTLLSVQAWMAIIRFVFDYEDKRRKRQVVATGYFIEIISFIIYTIGFIIVALVFDIKFPLSLYFLGASYMLVQNMTFTCRGLGYNRLFVISGIVGSAAQLITSLLFIFGFHWGASALLCATAFSYFSQGIFIEICMGSFRKFRLKDVNIPLMKKMLRYCIPTSLNQGTWWINTQACTLIITAFLGEAAVGIYSAPSKLTSLITMIVMVFNLAWQEFTFSICKSKQRDYQYNYVLNSFIRFIGCGMLFLIPITSVLFTLIIGPEYAEGKNLVPLLYLGTVLDALASFIGSIMQAEKRVKSMFLSQTVGAVITIVSMLVSIRWIGLQSAAVAMILCFMAVTVIRTLSLRSAVKLHYDWLFVIHYTLIFVITSFVYLYCSQLVNLLFAIPLAAYCIFCLRDIIKGFIKMGIRQIEHARHHE